MNMLDRVNDDMTKAMRAQDRPTLGPLRMLKTPSSIAAGSKDET